MAEPLDPTRDDDAVDLLVRQALPDEAAPAGFAERALARRGQRRRWLVPAAGAAALAAAAAALVVVATRGTPAEGTLHAQTRETLTVGRATVVANPGAGLAWSVAPDGAALVQQSAGSAFFRVERGHAPFVVETAAARVVVHGTCFTVTVDPGADPGPLEPAMPSLAVPSRLPSLAAGLALGATLAGAVTVAVHEGRVSLENPQGQVSVGPGEQARAERGGAPHTTTTAVDVDTVARTTAALARAEQALAASRAASAGDVRALLDENAQLRAELSAQRAEVAVMQAERAEDRGAARPFPDDLPPRFTQAALLKNFQQAFTEVGMKAEVSHIDCTEYPCLVFGKVHGDTRDLMKDLQKSSVFGEYADDGKSVLGWARGDDEPEEFAVALTPKGDDEADEREELGRRIRWRVDQGRAGSR